MIETILLPMIIWVMATFMIGFVTIYKRIMAIKTKQVSSLYFKHNKGKAPESILRWGDNFSNQFEMPVLFYLLAGLILALGVEHAWFVPLAWMFILFRFGHACEHVLRNHIFYRMLWFVSSAMVLIIMWIILIIEIFGETYA